MMDYSKCMRSVFIHMYTSLELTRRKGECLSKLPIMQHVLFGSLLRFEVL